MDQPEQDVLGADVIVVEQPRFLLSEDDDSTSPIGESFEHCVPASHGGKSLDHSTQQFSNPLVGTRSAGMAGVTSRNRPPGYE